MVGIRTVIAKIRNIHMNKWVTMGILAVGIVLVAGAATVAVLATVMPKNNAHKETTESSKEKAKRQAAQADSEAKKLMSETKKLGNGKEADKKVEEAIVKFNEAGTQYQQAGDNHESIEAKANADALASTLEAQKKRNEQLEADQAKQKADYEAAKAAMQAANP